MQKKDSKPFVNRCEQCSQTGSVRDADELDHHPDWRGAPKLHSTIRRIGSQVQTLRSSSGQRPPTLRGARTRRTRFHENLYHSREPAISPRDLVNLLRQESYISLESALVDKGITSQGPSVLTCVTPGYPQSFRTKSVGIIYRKISPDLYWGYEEKSTRHNRYLIAEPEKALLEPTQ